MKKIAILSLALLLAASMATASPSSKKKKEEPYKGYKFELFIYDCVDSIMYLGNYYAGQTYAFDTAVLSPRGMFRFENKERVLKPGLYFFTSPSGNYVEFAVYGNEKLDFHFDTEEPGWQENMRVKGSKENQLLFRFHQTNRAIYRTIDSAATVIADSAEKANFRRSQLRKLDSIKEAMISQNPNSLLALMMNATREPMVPRVDSTGKALSSNEQWQYFMDHYFDHTKLEDDALIRTPDMIFHKRLTDYLDKGLRNAPPEVIIEYVDKIIERSRPSKENFRYLVHTIAEKYLQSNVMSYDAVYVHMIKKYVETGECYWMSPTTVDENVKRANTWDKLLIGKKAPQLILKDSEGQFHSLEALSTKYTLLVFWSPTCGHCKTEIPSLNDAVRRFQNEKNLDISVFAILSEPDDHTRPLWRDFIKQHNMQEWINLDGGEANIDWHEVYDIQTTPQIYLLDKDKTILAKKLSATSFEEVIRILERY